MKKLRFDNCQLKFDVRKSSIIKCYMWIELCVWCFLTYSSVYHGKIFDYKYIETEEFVSHVEGGEGGNWYYRLMFGNLNLTNIDFESQRGVQGEIETFVNSLALTKFHANRLFLLLDKCDTLNTLFVFVFGLYFILTIFFLIGMSKVGLAWLRSCSSADHKCLLADSRNKMLALPLR